MVILTSSSTACQLGILPAPKMELKLLEADARQDETTAASGFTADIAVAASGLNAESISEEALRRAENCFLDFFGTTIAGTPDLVVDILLDTLSDAEGREQAGLIGRYRKVPMRLAALVNGTAGHALDYDDTHLTMPGHVSVAVIPALLALAEHRRYSGIRLLTALVAAFDAGCVIGAALAPGHYERGFHATATIGAMAAAAGAARLVGLDARCTSHAIGIAATSAAGLQGMFGTMCKPLHAGRAAEAGLLAVLLAERGFITAENSIECRQGFADTHSPDFTPRMKAPCHGDRHIADNLFKFHAACYGTHAVIDAALDLSSRLRLNSCSIRKVTLEVAADNDTVCNIAEPQTDAEARFSLRHVVAMVLARHDTSDPRAYGDASLRDPAVVDLRNRTIVRLVQGREITLGSVTLDLEDGSKHSAYADAGVPDTDLDREAERLQIKFDSLVAPLLGETRTRDLADRLLRLRDAEEVSELTTLSAYLE